MSEPLLSNLVFTKSVGLRNSPKDTTFNDVIDYGQFPAENTIKGIKQIQVFSDTDLGDSAVITGLIVEYDGVSPPIPHGVVNVSKITTLTINPEKELLVGVYGRLKDQPGDPNDQRIASIGFVVFDKPTGKVTAKGPYQGTTEYLGTPWATFGPIVALQGTTKDGIGLTTLGFVKSTPGNVKVFGRDGNYNAGEDVF